MMRGAVEGIYEYIPEQQPEYTEIRIISIIVLLYYWYLSCSYQQELTQLRTLQRKVLNYIKTLNDTLVSFDTYGDEQCELFVNKGGNTK